MLQDLLAKIDQGETSGNGSGNGNKENVSGSMSNVLSNGAPVMPVKNSRAMLYGVGGGNSSDSEEGSDSEGSCDFPY
jgi:hypothetical protein